VKQLERDQAVPNEPQAGINSALKQAPGYETDDLLAENRRLRSGLEQMREEVLRLGRALETLHQLQEEVLHLRGEVDRLRANSRIDHERADQLAALVEATARMERDSSDQLTAVYASSSWRITGPLRWVMRCIRR
jgi:predicted RNase H-like nuclease (RuvC/YqgF family)